MTNVVRKRLQLCLQYKCLFQIVTLVSCQGGQKNTALQAIIRVSDDSTRQPSCSNIWRQPPNEPRVDQHTKMFHSQSLLPRLNSGGVTVGIGRYQKKRWQLHRAHVQQIKLVEKLYKKARSWVLLKMAITDIWSISLLFLTITYEVLNAIYNIFSFFVSIVKLSYLPFQTLIKVAVSKVILIKVCIAI